MAAVSRALLLCALGFALPGRAAPQGASWQPQSEAIVDDEALVLLQVDATVGRGSSGFALGADDSSKDAGPGTAAPALARQAASHAEEDDLDATIAAAKAAGLPVDVKSADPRLLAAVQEALENGWSFGDIVNSIRSAFRGTQPTDSPADVELSREAPADAVTAAAVANATAAAAKALGDKATAAVANATAAAITDIAESATAHDEKCVLCIRKCVAEFIAMTLFVFIGCGSAMSVCKTPGSAWVLQVALTFGIAITVLAYTIGHYSGAQINCAVTFALVLSGEVTWQQGLGNLAAQLLGSLVGALILLCMYGPTTKEGGLDKTGGLGANGVHHDWSVISALIGEIVGTFVLVYVVHEMTVNPVNKAKYELVAPLAIGFAVFLAHSVLVPVDGCSINPTRSFGPAVVNVINDGGDALAHLWVFWLGPLAGAAAASGVYKLMTDV